MKTAITLACLSAAALALSACASSPKADDPTWSDAAYKICKVEYFQNYVGQNRSTIPEPPHGQTFRVLCSSCAATMDYRENRVNFVFDEATNIIKEVKCG